MKIKTDFVTNSSSVCYIVFVPNEFSVTDSMIEEAIEDEKCYWDDDDTLPPNVENMREEVSECVELLKQGDNIYRNSYGDGVDTITYSIVQNILNSNDMDLTSIDISSDGEDIIAGITEEKVMKIMANNMDLNKLIKVTTK